ncbi:hypothetical protein FKP32DRAFT_152919 [Trametes sanguinea]|nr:hypothetical protein FKP32DRAFT_152919 [Trametes sanguinea]
MGWAAQQPSRYCKFDTDLHRTDDRRHPGAPEGTGNLRVLSRTKRDSPRQEHKLAAPRARHQTADTRHQTPDLTTDSLASQDTEPDAEQAHAARKTADTPRARARTRTRTLCEVSTYPASNHPNARAPGGRAFRIRNVPAIDPAHTHARTHAASSRSQLGSQPASSARKTGRCGWQGVRSAGEKRREPRVRPGGGGHGSPIDASTTTQSRAEHSRREIRRRPNERCRAWRGGEAAAAAAAKRALRPRLELGCMYMIMSSVVYEIASGM